MVAVAPHPVLLRSASLGDQHASGQLILERTDREFIPAILDELTRPGGTADLLRTRAAARTPDNVLKLFQPVQRTFNVALFEVVCDVPGRPRFDPARIETAGLVVRRIPRDNQGIPQFDQLEGWCQDGRTLKGWVPLATRDALDRDPDATRRPVPGAGHREVDRRLARFRGVTERLSETVTPLFPAPPEVCRATGKTILFGVIPLASAELSEAPTEQSAFTDKDIQAEISPYFKASGLAAVPCAGDWVSRAEANDRELRPWVNMLRQLVVEFDAFGESPQSRDLRAALDRIEVPPLNRPAGEMLRAHAEELVVQSSAPRSVHMPPWWPKIDPVVANAVAFEARKAVNARFAALVAPRQPRFDQRTRPSAQVRKRLRTVVPPGSYADTGDMYRLRAFVRVRHHEHCPPHTVWSEHSERFTIAAWYEGTGAPPVPVSLPDPTDGDFLKQLRPNVAFTVPGGLFNLLQNNDPKNLLSGRGSSGGPSQPGWVCGFNIPIITICAFVLLNIMLVLLHMLFWWLPFVKICFPIPSSLRPRP